MKKIFKRYLPLVALLSLTACGGGGGSSSQPANPSSNSTNEAISSVNISESEQVKTPSSAYVVFSGSSSNASKAMLATSNSSGNSCFTLVSTNGKTFTTTQNSQPYYSTATINFAIQNTCGSAQAMAGLGINISNFLINGNPGRVNWIEQGSGSPYLTVTSSASGANLNMSVSTPGCTGNYCDWSLMPAGSTRQFVIHADVNDSIKSFTVSNVQIAGSTPVDPAAPGSLAVKVTSSALAPICGSSTACRIGINVTNSTGAKLDEIWVNPYESPVYTKVYNNLLIGKYSISVDPNTYPSNQGGTISVTYNPVDGIISVNSNQTSNSSVTFSYTAPQPIGNLVVNLAGVAESAIFSGVGSLTGLLTNTTTKATTTFTVGLNGKATLNNLASGSYTLSVQGLADPATGVYYSPWNSGVTISTGKTTTTNVSLSKVTSGFHTINFVVESAPSSQTVSYAQDLPRYKYKSDALINGTTPYTFLNSESAVALTIIQPSGYSLTYNPTVVTPTTSSVRITYTNLNPTPPPVVTGGALTTLNDQIVDSKGNVVKLKGINWFGFNNGDMLNGMWNWDPISGDFASTVWRLKALGFNAVRLPFSFALINGGITNTYGHNGVTPASSSTLQTNLTNPSYSSAGKTFPSLAYNPTQSYSNQLLPNNTTLDRFMWVIDFFARNGFYVLIDDHLREDQTILNSGQAVWVQNWKSLAQKIYASMPESSANRVMFDLLNEPDNFGIRWETPTGTQQIRLDQAYLAAMDAINTVTNNKNLFFVEGTGQSGINANWGDGYATDKTIIQQKGLSDPNNFFTQLAAKPYVSQVVLSPHVYPPSVTYATQDYAGSGLYNRLSTSFGYLAKTGYCVNAVCHKYPIAIGEFGSTFDNSATTDLQFFQSFASYLNNNNDAMDGKHNAINNWFYWSYNPNSGDTGGIVDDSWINIVWKKIDYLSYGVLYGMPNTNPNGIGLSPWYK